MFNFTRIIIVLSIGMFTGSTALAAEKVSYQGAQIDCGKAALKQVDKEHSKASYDKKSSDVDAVE